MAVSWPAPSALSGVKSKKKPVFKVASGTVVSPCCTLDITDVSLCLESRLLAVGDAGRLLVEVLLQEQELSSGKAIRHEQLVALRLGPELAGLDAGPSEHKRAVLKALQASKPHVIVLDEAAGLGVRGWSCAFRELARSDAVRSYKGAVIVCSAKESFALRGVCDERWSAARGQMRQSPCGGDGLEIIEDALVVPVPSGKAAKKRGARDAAEYAQALLAEARELSEAEFEEDVVDVCQEEGWTLTLLVDTATDGANRLKGYLCYKTRSAPCADLHVSRVCTPRRLRGKGHGVLLMQWAMEKAQQLPDETCRSVSLAALDTVVPFYTKLGFVARGREKVKDGEDPQTVMDWSASLDVPAVGM